MSKQKLAQMVMQKMLEKKAREQANRPHYEVLQLMVQFNAQQNLILKQEIKKIQQQIEASQSLNANLEKHCQQLENTGKKDFPRIIIKPQFIASENISVLIKEFYRKSANSFLKMDILRKKVHQQFLRKQEQIKRMIRQINLKQQNLRTCLAEHLSTQRQKRVKVLKQDLKLRLIKDDQRRIQELTENQRMDNIDLIKQYDIKKSNLDNRIEYSQILDREIRQQKDIIERTYNPIAHREYMRLMFLIRAKNEKLKKNLFEAVAKIESLNQNSQKHQKYLVNNTQSFLFYGRTYDSPSRNPGRRQKQREKHLSMNKDQQQTKQVSSIKKRKNSEHRRDFSLSRYSSAVKASRSMTNINASGKKKHLIEQNYYKVIYSCQELCEKTDFLKQKQVLRKFINGQKYKYQNLAIIQSIRNLDLLFFYQVSIQLSKFY